MTVSPDFVKRLDVVVDKMLDNMQESGMENMTYILLAIEDGDINKIASNSNMPPEMMLGLLRMLARTVEFVDIKRDDRRVH